MIPTYTSPSSPNCPPAKGRTAMAEGRSSAPQTVLSRFMYHPEGIRSCDIDASAFCPDCGQLIFLIEGTSSNNQKNCTFSANLARQAGAYFIGVRHKWDDYDHTSTVDFIVIEPHYPYASKKFSSKPWSNQGVWSPEVGEFSGPSLAEVCNILTTAHTCSNYAGRVFF